MQALQARDAAKAQRLMREHFENGLAAAGGQREGAPSGPR
jgi:DNA-binding GntR family transcriptional regulator